VVIENQQLDNLSKNGSRDKLKGQNHEKKYKTRNQFLIKPSLKKKLLKSKKMNEMKI